MHPAPSQLTTMTTPQLREYRHELVQLAAVRGYAGYGERVRLIDEILQERWVAEHIVVIRVAD